MQNPERLPLWLLLLALSTLFPYSFDKGYFYRPGNHDWITALHLTVAENLSPDHGFRLFLGRRPGSGGAPAYEMYSRFPVGGYALIKLAILPFGNDLSAKILAARMLMLLSFSAAALLAFHSLARITSRPWIALAATLAAFSSYYLLLYSNAVSVETSVDLFAVMLVFHGMVVFVQEGRFRQLLARTCVALLLGWHVYAFLLPFLILGLASEAVRAWKEGTAVWPRVRSIGAAVLRSRYTALGVFALLFGAVVLGFNFANEYAAFGGQTPVTELPSFQSMLSRTGLDQDPNSTFDRGGWLHFLRQQFRRVCVASVPSVTTDWGAKLRGWFPSVDFWAPGLSGPKLSLYLLALLMVMVASTTVVRLARRLLAWRHSMLLATLALSGFFWALPMRHNVAYSEHDPEAMFYVGVPLVFYSLLLLYVHKRLGRGHGPVVGLAVAALLTFVVSVFQMDHRWRIDAYAAEIQQAALAELGSIRETTRGKVVLILGSIEPEGSWQVTGEHKWKYYLAGSVLWRFLHPVGADISYNPAGSVPTRFPDMEAVARAADFLLTRDRVESGALLTPGNEQVFLYDSAGIDDLVELYRSTYQRVVSGEPAARSYFDVYLHDDALVHIREPCVREDVPEQVFARYGRGKLFIYVWRSGVLFEGKCMVILPLPDYPVSGIRTGHMEARRKIWEVEVRFPTLPETPGAAPPSSSARIDMGAYALRAEEGERYILKSSAQPHYFEVDRDRFDGLRDTGRAQLVEDAEPVEGAGSVEDAGSG